MSFVPISERQTETVVLRLEVNVTPELAARLVPHLRKELDFIGDTTDDGWDARVAPLDALMARYFDRQRDPLEEMRQVSGEDLWEDYVTFAQVIA